MSEMVERVAKALAREYDRDPETDNVGLGTQLSTAMARAAIAAMREPTEAMLYAGWQEDSSIWRAMIDAALKD